MQVMATFKQGEEPINEIRNYPDTSNKEIEYRHQIPGAESVEDGWTYFFDHSGQYYYQSNAVDGDDGTATLVTPNEGHVMSLPSSWASNEEGEGGFQTATILPPESPSGEVTHVVILQQPDGGDQTVISSEVLDSAEGRPHTCSVCERGFKTAASLQNHVNSHTGTKAHRCIDCHCSFTTSGAMMRHVRYRHTHDKAHRCTECDYASVELSKLKRHMRCHTGERPHQCPHCTYASPDTFTLKRHLRIHTGEKPYQCDTCHARFTQSNSLKAHTLIHTGNKPAFQCALCPTTCARKTDLRIHVQKLHTSDKPLKCKRCGQSFPDCYTFKLHSKTHEGEKCFKCDLCAYASISQRRLQSHMLIHTDQKPYQCDQCDQCFRQKQLLRRHQNLHHNADYVPPPPGEKRHECPQCGKAFRRQGNLIRHSALHDPEGSKQRINDGQSLEELTEGDQQYVALKDIQFEGEGGEEDEGTDMEVEAATEFEDSILEGDGITMTSLDGELDDELEDSLQAAPRLRSKVSKAQSTSKDVTNCFGFDEDEDD